MTSDTVADVAVARVMVDTPLAHLDRPFDYAVPDGMTVTAGLRVRVRFSGRLVDGYVLEVGTGSTHSGRLASVERAVGTEPMLTDETATLFRAVADRMAGTFSDVARLGVPPRHARAEATHWRPGERRLVVDTASWARYQAGAAFVDAVRDGRPARAVWSALPGDDWPLRLAELAQVALTQDRGVVLVVPDNRDVQRVDGRLSEVLGEGHHVVLSADLGPERRYRNWLAVRRGEVRVVLGTRSAAFAPVADSGLLVIWDDGDDLHAEPRAPYPHSRDVLVQRSALAGTALLLGGFARTAEAQLLLESDWAHEIHADRATVRGCAPRVTAVGDDREQARDPAAAAARLPSLAWRTARAALGDGPVLVQVPRRGYLPALACQNDRTPARCSFCSGPLAASSGHAIPTCRWCGRPAGNWTCPACGQRRLRAVVVGAARTAEEIGRAFPGVTVRTSGGSNVLAEVPPDPALVIATPGAEPVAPEGYTAALLLDGWALLSRADLRAAEETFRRWANAVALVRPHGEVVVGADAGVPAVQALVRWDPARHAVRELADRTELRFPPAERLTSVTGAAAAIADLLAQAELPAGHDLIGPVPIRDGVERVLVRVPRASGAELAAALKAAQAVRSARKAPDPVRVQLDPLEVL
jgi:primosomal protein N' (replication factor Y) (superfamily II helicase)